MNAIVLSFHNPNPIDNELLEIWTNQAFELLQSGHGV